MWNIIKAQNYQTRNDIVVIVALICVGAISVVSPMLNGISLDNITGSVYAVNSDKTFLVFVALIFTSRICGWDQSDKTINYELLAGHDRSAVYFGRIIATLIWVTISSAVLMIAPLGIFTAINGWGYSAELSWVLIRYLLALLTIIRVTFEFALLTFILRSSGLSLVLGYLLIVGALFLDIIFSMDTDKNKSWLLGVTNLMHVTGFPDYSFGYVNGEDVIVYESTLDATLIVGTTAASVLVGAVCLIIGNVLFRKRDMK